MEYLRGGINEVQSIDGHVAECVSVEVLHTPIEQPQQELQAAKKTQTQRT